MGVPGTKEAKGHAFTSSSNGSDCSGCSALVGQSLHTDAGNDQVHPECNRGHWGGVVAPGHFWTVPFAIPDPRRDITHRLLNSQRREQHAGNYLDRLFDLGALGRFATVVSQP
jgi:hypothetical protein